MMKDDLSNQASELAKAAHEAGDERLAKWIAFYYLLDMYPEAARDEVLKGVDAALGHLAKLSREAADAVDAREAREWFRDFEWPDELQ
jgi:hypothetical protein